jgi:cytidine deaminase
VENASYGLTICAERAAVCAAISAGARRFRRVVVVSDSDPPAAPCGACRQVLSEFGPGLRVDAVGPRGNATWTAAELLPAAFGRDQLS